MTIDKAQDLILCYNPIIIKIRWVSCKHTWKGPLKLKTLRIKSKNELMLVCYQYYEETSTIVTHPTKTKKRAK